MKLAVYISLIVLSSIVPSKSARAEFQAEGEIGYMSGSFISQPIGGYLGIGSLAYQTKYSFLILEAGLLQGYSQLNYTVNGLEKNVRWYFNNIFLASGVHLSKTWLMQLRASYSLTSKFFVFSNTGVEINQSSEKVEEYTQYKGGSTIEAGLSVISYADVKRGSPKPYWGFKFSNFSQKFTSKKQRVVVTRTDEDSYDATTSTSGSFNINLNSVSIIFGIEL